MKKTLSTLLIFLLFFSCEEPVEPLTPVVDAELAAIIQKFVDEGNQRGVNLSTDDLEAFLVDEFSLQVGSGGFCGYGWWNYPGQGNPRMEIRKTGPCWTDRTDLEKENLIFHELGHSLLRRIHINGNLPNGTTPKSIMCGDGVCSNYHTFFADGLLRDYYLDELFDEQTPFPNSFINKRFTSIAFQEDFENYADDWEIFHFKEEDSPEQYSVMLDSTVSNNTTLHALAIKNPAAIEDSAEILVLKRFDISSFGECSNLIAKANIRTEGLRNGSFSMGVSLRERKSNGALQRIFLNSKKQESFAGANNSFENFVSETYCIPENTDVVTISFLIYSPSPASVFIDDVVLELWE